MGNLLSFISCTFLGSSEPIIEDTNTNIQNDDASHDIGDDISGDANDYGNNEIYSPSSRYDVDNVNSFDSDHNEEIESIHTMEKKQIFTRHGVKKGLIIGINYASNETRDDDLRGCLNDSYNIEQLLKSRCNFEQNHITKLNDIAATKYNIMSELHKLVEFSQQTENCEIWLSFSGHGGGIYDFYEEDNQKEFICPSDYLTSGIIEDSWMKEHFIDKLSKTTKCFVLMDCCNSGSNMNLPFVYENNDEAIEQDTAKIIKISGSMDSQTSADYYDVQDRSFQGALTNSFLKSVNCEKRTILSSYNHSVYDLSSRNFTQIPQLSFTDSTLINYSLY